MLKIYCIETVKNISLINKKENPLAYTYTQVIILWTSKFCLNMSDWYSCKYVINWVCSARLELIQIVSLELISKHPEILRGYYY